jgi:DHA1 family bicyclomycin/chloramphenicol resistance-like MFS transporter
MNAPDTRVWVIVPLVASLLMIAPFTVDAYLPSFPAIAREFGVNDAALQLTLSLYLWFFGGMMLIHGPLSDRFGRRRMVLISLIIYAMASIFAALAGSINELIAARIVQGIAAGAGVVIGRALVRDLFEGATAQRVMSNITFVFAVAPAIAPIIGGGLDMLFGWRSIFWFLALFASLSMLGVLGFMPETVGAHNRQSIAPKFILVSYLKALRDRPFMGLTLVFTLIFAGMFLYIAAAPLVLIGHLGQTPTDFWKLFVPLVIGLILGSRVSNFLASRYPPVRTVSVGILIAAVAVAFNLMQSLWFMAYPAPNATQIGWTVAPIMFYAMGMATAMPSLNLMGLDYIPAQRGLASALQGFTQMTLAGVVSGFAVAWLAKELLWLALGMLMLWGTAALIWLWWLQNAPRLGFASERSPVPLA